MKVVRATRHTKPCEDHVRLAVPKTATRTMREWRAQRDGVDPAICRARAAYVIDGKPYCLNHAGQVALRHLVEQSK